MRLTITAAAAALAVCFALPALRADDQPKAELPVNGLASAQVGDWATYLTVEDDGHGNTRKNVTTWTITKVDGDNVTISREKKKDGPEGKPREVTINRKEPLTVQNMFQMPPELPITNFATADDKHTVGGKEFACKKVTFDIAPPNEQGKISMTIWMCADVAGYGMVEAQMLITQGDAKETNTATLAGYGAKDAVTWGKAPKDVDTDAGSK